jgi:hypothetical protein
VAQTVAWEFFTTRFTTLMARFSEGQSFILSGMVKGISAGFTTAADADILVK